MILVYFLPIFLCTASFFFSFKNIVEIKLYYPILYANFSFGGVLSF